MEESKSTILSKIAGLEVIKDFEGASVGQDYVHNDRVFVKFREEPLVMKDGLVHNYNWHFAFGVKNHSDNARAIEIFINCENKSGLPHQAYLLGQRSLDLDFTPLGDIEAYTDTFKKYYVKALVQPNETLYISNTFFRNLKLVYGIFENISQNPHCRKQIYGRSVEERSLFSYLYSEDGRIDNQKPLILVTSGFHPMEADTFAAEAIMEHLGTPQGKDLLKHFNFVIIPVVNPDGFFYGYNGCNAKGINLYWDFRQKDKLHAPESYYLWQYILRIRPCVYIDFHSYTFQLHRKKDSPYVKPIYFYSGKKVRQAFKKITSKLADLHGGRRFLGELTFAPSTLSYKLTKKFNTITYAKYHLHIRGGKEKYKRQSVNIIDRIVHCLIDEGMLRKYDILLHPHGKAKTSIKDSVGRTMKMTWTFRLRPFIKKCLNRK
ncbi:MAG: hypothetical protein JSW40_02040 [Candidatus Omnitrophota bacterium]|nr:MAG: hypothetical protein JSW40_02040 [Candidatus Omnitrophota bacterium]